MSWSLSKHHPAMYDTMGATPSANTSIWVCIGPMHKMHCTITMKWQANSPNGYSRPVRLVTWHTKPPATIKRCIGIHSIYPQNTAWGTADQQWATGIQLSAQHRAGRLACCRRYRNWINKWHRVLFTDESRFFNRRMMSVDRCGLAAIRESPLYKTYC